MLNRSSCSPPALHRKQKTHTHIDTGSTPLIELQRKELNSPTRPASRTSTGQLLDPNPVFHQKERGTKPGTVQLAAILDRAALEDLVLDSTNLTPTQIATAIKVAARW